jgi:transposase
VQGTIVEGVSVEEDEEGEMAAVVVAVHLRRGDQGRCGRCRRRCPGYDRGEGRRHL